MSDPYGPREMGDPHTLRQGLLPWANPIGGDDEAAPRDGSPPFPLNVVVNIVRLVRVGIRGLWHNLARAHRT